MTSSPHSVASLSWYLKFIGVPVTVAVAMCGIFNQFSKRKRREALQEKVVVITGASSGIGEALAHAFYEQGSKVVLAARRESELNRVKNDLISKTVALPAKEPVVVPLDLADLGSVESFVERVRAACGDVDVLVNNGGVSHRAAALHTRVEVDKQIMDINYFGSVALTKAVLPGMVQRKSGHILFVSSVQGLIAIPDRSAYAASKHALQAFGDALRAEVHQHRVHVTVVSPGYVKTSISLNSLDGSGGHHGVMDASTAAGFAPEYCAREILDAVVFCRKEVIISQFLPRLAIFIRHCSPSLYFWLMARRANKTT